MKKHTLLAVFASLIFAIILAGCSSGPKTANIDVSMTDFKFNPETVNVPAGGEVTLNLENDGTLEHEWVIMLMDKTAAAPFDADDEANIYWEAELQPGISQEFTFTAPETPGEYQLVCGTAGHLEAGMVGTLIVE